MRSVITGVSKIQTHELSSVMPSLSDKTRNFRFVHDLERLTAAAVELLMRDAGVHVPVGNDAVGLYIGIDDCIETIKDEFLEHIVREGLLGASPLLFPFTSPNALAAQATILFDLRGECVVMPVRDSTGSVMAYADECVSGNYARMAAAGGIFIGGGRSAGGSPVFEADFYLMEGPESARDRGARVYEDLSRMIA